MGNWLHSFSKNMLAFCAIAGGIIFIILQSPPRSVCDAQVDVIKDSEKKFLYADPAVKAVKTTPYEILRDRCQHANNPGGCYELFQKIKVLLDDLTTLTSECAPAGGRIPEVQKALWETIELMVNIAWGEKAPASYNLKFGWLDKADVTLFCGLKARISYVFGEPAYDRFRERMMLELPGAKDLTRQQVWELSLFSENCARYP